MQKVKYNKTNPFACEGPWPISTVILSLSKGAVDSLKGNQKKMLKYNKPNAFFFQGMTERWIPDNDTRE